MGTEIVPVRKSRLKPENNRKDNQFSLDIRADNTLAPGEAFPAGSDFFESLSQIRAFARRRQTESSQMVYDSQIPKPDQRPEREKTQFDLIPIQPRQFVTPPPLPAKPIRERRPLRNFDDSLHPLEPLESNTFPKNGIIFGSNGAFPFESEPNFLGRPNEDIESQDFILKSYQPRHFESSFPREPEISSIARQQEAPLSTRNPDLLIDTLADRLSQGLDERFERSSFKAELVLEGNSFAITPIEIEPLSFDEALSAQLDTKVNLLVNGAAMLEKRKYEPPPLTRQEERALDRNIGQILKTLDEIVEGGTKRAGGFIASRWGKTGLSFAGMTGLALASSACSGRMVPIEPIPLEPTVSESEPVAPIELLEPTAEKLPTPITANITSPYPTTAEGFLVGVGGPGNAEERIRELGAGGDIEKMRGMLIAEMNRTGINPETIEWEFAINEQAENPSWTMWSKDRLSGQFLLPKLTSGPDAGQLVRSGNLFAYLDREIGDDFFDLVELQNPQGLVGVEQRIIPDNTGWFVPGGFDSEGEILNWFSVDRDEWGLVGNISTERNIVIENNMVYEEQESGKLDDLFPGSEVYKTERGDVVVVNEETGIRLAGQTIETKYGSYTFLVSNPAYQKLLRNLVGPETFDEEQILAFYPEGWVADPRFKQYFLDEIGSIEELQGYRDGGDQLTGYPNLLGSPLENIEEMMRAFSTLLALNRGEISINSVNLATYEPVPKDFVMVTMTPGNVSRLAESLPKGVVDLSSPTAVRQYGPNDVGLTTVKTEDGVFVNAVFRGTYSGIPGATPEVFYDVFLDPFVMDPMGYLMLEARQTQQLEHHGETNPYFEGVFAPLFSNPELYYHLSAGSSEYYPIKPPFGSDIRIEKSQWMRFGVTSIEEVDLGSFE